MKKVITLLLTLYLHDLDAQCKYTNFNNPESFTIPCPPSNYDLVFEDHFNGNQINNTNWWLDYTAIPTTEGEYGPAVFIPENVYVENGICKIKVLRETHDWNGISFPVTAGSMRAKQNYSPGEHLIMEARIKIPATGDCLWPAFWTFSIDYELDFFEVFDIGSSSEVAISQRDWTSPGNDPWDCQYKEPIPNQNYYHIWRAEINPYTYKVFVDGVQIGPTFKKYKNIDLECGDIVPAGTLRELKSFFDVPNTYFGPLLWMSAWFNCNTNNLQPTTLDIDWVKVWRGKPCISNNDYLLVEDGQNITIDQNTQYQGIFIEEGGILNINNCQVEFPNEGRLTVDGGTLNLNNATLKPGHCGYWKGVSATKGSTLEIINQSKISKAEIGLSMGKAYKLIPDSSPSLILENSHITDCGIGIYFGPGETDSEIKNTYIRNGNLGLYTFNSYGLTIENIYIYNTPTCVNLVDSSVKIENSTFKEGEIGVLIEGTYPLSAGIIMGDYTGLHTFNVFEDLDFGVVVDGVNDPVGASIYNNVFTNVNQIACYLGGDSQTSVRNNTTNNNLSGLMSDACGENENLFFCNQLNNSQQGNIIFQDENSNTSFLNNYFGGSNFSNVLLHRAKIQEDIGQNNLSASNCFTPNAGLIELGPSETFNYHYFDDATSGNCQEPYGTATFGKIEANIEIDYCDSKVGVYNLIETGSEQNIIQDPFCKTHITWTQVLDSISHWATKVINEGGDNPYTSEVDPVGPSLPSLNWTVRIFDQWVNYALYRSIKLNNEEGGLGILNSLQAYKWQRRLFGYYLRLGDIESADSLLGALPQSNLDQINFVLIQSLNIKRLRDEEINNSELNILFQFANSQVPSKGYARSLYHLLTGDNVPISIPQLPSPQNLLSSIQDQSNKEILFFPNPANEKLTIRLRNHLSAKISVVDLFGRVFYEKLHHQPNSEINVSNLKNGVYLVSIEEGEIIKTSKLIIQH